MTSPNPRPNMMYEWKGHPSPPKGWRFSRETMTRLDAEGRIWYPDDTGKRPQLKRYLDEMPGILLGNIWTDISPINAMAAERLGYPTQKPLALLERIVSASSNPGDVVLDPFCGCGTAVAAAEKLDRRWVGIDITHLAITLVISRMKSMFPDITLTLDGDPKDTGGAYALAEKDRYDFQLWALSLIAARPVEDSKGRPKKGADRGIDGILTFPSDDPKRPHRGIVQVKSGHVSSAVIRDLKGTMERDGAEMGVLITLQEPTGPMRTEALEAGFYTSPWTGQRYPRIQVWTIAEHFNGQQPQLPPRYNPFPLAEHQPRPAQQRQLFASGGSG